MANLDSYYMTKLLRAQFEAAIRLGTFSREAVALYQAAVPVLKQTPRGGINSVPLFSMIQEAKHRPELIAPLFDFCRVTGVVSENLGRFLERCLVDPPDDAEARDALNGASLVFHERMGALRRLRNLAVPEDYGSAYDEDQASAIRVLGQVDRRRWSGDENDFANQIVIDTIALGCEDLPGETQEAIVRTALPRVRYAVPDDVAVRFLVEMTVRYVGHRHYHRQGELAASCLEQGFCGNLLEEDEALESFLQLPQFHPGCDAAQWSEPAEKLMEGLAKRDDQPRFVDAHRQSLEVTGVVREK